MRVSFILLSVFFVIPKCAAQPEPESYSTWVSPLLKHDGSFVGSINWLPNAWMVFAAYGINHHLGFFGQLSAGFDPDSTIDGHHYNVQAGVGLFDSADPKISHEAFVAIG